MTERIRASFDRAAEQYALDFADELSRKPWDVERLRAFARACPRGPVLDVGCGPAGHIGHFLAGLGPRVIGVDLSALSLVVARRLHPAIPFVAADVHALPFAEGTCAGAVAFYSLIYEDLDRTAHALGELRRVLQRGGLVLIAVHGGDGVHHFSDYKGIPVDVELHLRSRDALTARVASAGFAIEASEARPPYPFEHATERVYVAARAR